MSMLALSMTLNARVGILPPWLSTMGLKPDSGSTAVGSKPSPRVAGDLETVLYSTLMGSFWPLGNMRLEKIPYIRVKLAYRSRRAKVP